METLPATTTNMLGAITRELEQDPRLRSTHTRRGYLHDLKQFETWRAGRTLTKGLVEQYAASLQRAGRAASGINRALAAIRWWSHKVGDLAFEDGDMEPSTRQEIITQAARVSSIADVRGGARARVGRHIGYGEIDALLRVCANDHTAAGARDGAIFALAAATGPRRAEVVGLTLADVEVNLTTQEAVITIHGKGDKSRVVDLCNGGYAALADWLLLRGDAPGPLFFAIRRGGHIQWGEGLTTESLAQMLAKRASQAGITRKMTWHDLRRTLAGDLLDAGVDVVTVQKILGHASPTTTSRYDRRPDETRRRALRGRHLPHYTRGLA